MATRYRECEGRGEGAHGCGEAAFAHFSLWIVIKYGKSVDGTIQQTRQRESIPFAVIRVRVPLLIEMKANSIFLNEPTS